MVHPLLVGLGAVFLRNLTGWGKESFKDGVIQRFEYRLLFISTLRIGLLFTVTYYGLGIEEFAAGAISIIGDIVWKKINEMIDK